MNTSLLLTLPNDLQNILENYDVSSEENGILTITSCKLFCPTTFEVDGIVKTGFELEQTSQYGFFIDNLKVSTTYLKTPDGREIASGNWATRTDKYVVQGYYYRTIQHSYTWNVCLSIFFAI